MVAGIQLERESLLRFFFCAGIKYTKKHRSAILKAATNREWPRNKCRLTMHHTNGYLQQTVGDTHFFGFDWILGVF